MWPILSIGFNNRFKYIFLIFFTYKWNITNILLIKSLKKWKYLDTIINAFKIY